MTTVQTNAITDRLLALSPQDVRDALIRTHGNLAGIVTATPEAPVTEYFRCLERAVSDIETPAKKAA